MDNYLKFKHPFTCLISGPTSSGKTMLVYRIIKNKQLIIDKPLHKIYWYYSQWQEIYKNLPNVRFIKDIPNEKQLATDKPDLVVVDDLMVEVRNDQFILNLFTKFSHHMGISVILLVQNLFFKAPIMRSISLNSHYIIIMKNPRDKSQIMYLAKQIYPGETKYFIDCFKDATDKPYGYIKIDFTPSTPDKYRLSSRITPEEFDNLNFAPVIYTPCLK